MAQALRVEGGFRGQSTVKLDEKWQKITVTLPVANYFTSFNNAFALNNLLFDQNCMEEYFN